MMTPYINGATIEVDAAAMTPVVNPANGKTFSKVFMAKPEHMTRAIDAAYAVKDVWGNTLPSERELILIRAADVLESMRADVVNLLIEEGGSTFGKSQFEVSYVVGVLRSAAGECRRIMGNTIPCDTPGRFSMAIRRPLGVVGGIAPFAVSVCLWFALPESVRFLTLHERRWGELARVLRHMSPRTGIPADGRFVIHDETRTERFTPALLFVGSLLFITPLLWLFYIFNSVAVFFMQSWMPVLIQGLGLTAPQAALTTSVYSMGGTIGGLVTGQIIDRIGLSAVAVLPLAGAAVSAVVGLPMSVAILEAVVFAQGFFVVGAQFACTAIAPMFYPTAYRANAEGWALAVAKIGSIAGPVIGGVLLRMHLPGYQLFYVAAVPLLFSAVFAFGLGRAARSHRHSGAVAVEPAR